MTQFWKWRSYFNAIGLAGWSTFLIAAAAPPADIINPFLAVMLILVGLAAFAFDVKMSKSNEVKHSRMANLSVMWVVLWLSAGLVAAEIGHGWKEGAWFNALYVWIPFIGTLLFTWYHGYHALIEKIKDI